MLEIKNISKAYDGLQVFSGLSFKFPGNGLFIIEGKNGSGKSTLLGILSGKDSQYSGGLFFNGEELNSSNRNYYSDTYVSFIPQDGLVFDDETVIDNILLPFHEKDSKKARDILDKLGLGTTVNQKAGTLSGGEKQRVSFARALYDLKPIVLLDEITSNLDGESVSYILANISQMAKDHLVIFVTHENLPSDFIAVATIVSLSRGFSTQEGVSGKCTVEKQFPETPSCVEKKKTSLLKKRDTKDDVRYILSADKKNHGLLFGMTAALSALMLIFFSFVFSFGSDPTIGLATTDRYAETIRKIYADTSPIFFSDNASDGFSGESYAVESLSVTSSDKSNADYSKSGSLISGCFDFHDNDTDSKYPITITEGRKPAQKGEAIISDVCLEQMGDSSFKIGHSSIQLAGSDYLITGIYRSLDLAGFSDRYKKYDPSDDYGINNTTRISYGFMSETMFAYPSDSLSLDAYVSSDVNRKTFLDSGAKVSGPGYSPIAVDSNGSEVLLPFQYDNTYIMFGYLSLATLAVFYAVYIIGFYSRNKRRYLLLRFVGMRREVQTKANSIVFSSFVLLGYIVGIMLGIITVVLLDSVYRRVILGAIGRLFSFSCFLPYALALATIVLATLCFSIMLYRALSKKDVSKQMQETKMK